ncbi:hypothetical protein ACFL0Y_04680 [Patescibacteria group bacterium]
MNERRLRDGQGRRRNMFEHFSEVVDRGSMVSLCELSKMASGNERAAQLVDRIDEAVEAGEIELSNRPN